MVVAQIYDDVPTNTFNFDHFFKWPVQIVADDFFNFGYPENEGRQVVHDLAWLRYWAIGFVLKDNGTTAAAQLVSLENLIMSGGDNGGKWNIKWEREDSGGAIFYQYLGYIKSFQQLEAETPILQGTIQGEFEFWESNI